MFKVNITILPSTEDTGIFVVGLLEHSLVSDPSFGGHRDFKYIQNKNKDGSYFELNSEEPKTFGRYHLNAKHQVSIAYSIITTFKYNLIFFYFFYI